MAENEEKAQEDRAKICPIKMLRGPGMISDAKDFQGVVKQGVPTLRCERVECAWWVPSEDDCALKVIAVTLTMTLERWDAQDKRRGYT